MKKSYMVILTVLTLVACCVIPLAWAAYRNDRAVLVGGPHQTAAIQDAAGATGAPVLATKGYLLETFPVATGVLAGSSNSIWLGVDSIVGDTGTIIFEGATKNTKETRIGVVDPTADAVWLFPGNTVGPMYPMSTTLATNAPGMANSVTGGSNFIAFEGTVDAHETKLSATDATADVIYQFPTGAASTVYPMVSDLATNFPNIANSVWGTSNGVCWGVTAGSKEQCIVSAVTGTDRTITMPDATGTMMLSALATNAAGVANSVTGVSNGIGFEGATGDGTNVTTLTVKDPSAARTITLPDITGGVPVRIKNDITSVGDGASAALTSGSTITVPAAAWTTGASITVQCGGTASGTAATKTIALTLEGTTVFSTVSATADTGDWAFRGVVSYVSATTSKGNGVAAYQATLHSTVDQGITGTETVAGDINVAIIISTNKTAGGLTKEECVWTFWP